MEVVSVLGKQEWKRVLKAGDRVFIGSNAASPVAVVQQLLAHIDLFHDIELTHILTLGETPWAEAKYKNHLRLNSLFLGRGPREAVQHGYADYTPSFLSEVPALFEEGLLPLDVAIIQVTPPDVNGFCSMGVSVDVVSSAVRHAKHVIVQINAFMPRTFGESFIHIDQIDYAVEINTPIVELPVQGTDEVSQRIGQYVAMLVNDGSCLQLGAGRIPNAILSSLSNHNDLGLHSEMVSDGVIELLQNGNINNRYKKIRRGRSVTSFCVGTKRIYDYVDENPHFEFLPSEYVNNPAIIGKNDQVVAINSAIEVDLTGQVVSDSVGHRFYSGIGGQVDFIRGANLSRGGRPIIALPSTTKSGTVSRIVPFIAEGSGVVTTRGDVHYVVTEYGIASLRGKSIRERALELIQVAHPDFRDWLLEKVREHFWVPTYQHSHTSTLQEFGSVEMEKITLNCPGHFFIRPLHPSDERHLQEFFYSHTQETKLLRYRYNPEQMSREKAHSLVNVDQSKDPALCIIRKEGVFEQIEAVGRYYYIEATNMGEVAFVVRENMRGHGLARTLTKRLLQIAAQRKLTRMVAYVRPENTPMLKTLEKVNFTRIPSDDPMEVCMGYTFPSED
ncbi:acetyl-CoA hydrolase/transferase [Magnetococcus marinus MC-1]|uniref:Acetyl-CoA hydrolase/transferase n=1 Tax=Magnetococcus marinus (strain ATCC BAA-1437 / JCM 17883 / MC-1) TaxID=156889 RepID=A0L8K8_MAGMM|nr:GNAT family N-acetyltransferase [Magnetococcus marinus]ABK44301.1 acetyl-CoA hydrolase/transferase [Magnetococcus marinus MC-1]